MTRNFLIILFVTIAEEVLSQGFNSDKTALASFLSRMYNTSPFEGVKVVEDYDNNFLISVVSLEKAKFTSSSTMAHVAQVKAQSQANTFFNGSTITLDFIIKTTEEKDSTVNKTTIEKIESIKENSTGFVQGMELLTNFETEEGKRMLYIFFKELKKE